MFLNKKRLDGKIKGRTVAGRNKQQSFIPNEDAVSPTVSTEAVLMTCIIDVERNRDAAVIEFPNTFIQMRFKNEKDKAFIKIRGILLDILCDI